MSDVRSSHPFAAGASDLDACAAAWLIRQRERAGWSEIDEVELESWLAQSWAHRAAYWRVKAAWNYADRLNMLPHPSQGSRLLDAARTVFPLTLKIAAGFAVIAALGTGIFMMQTQPKGRTYATPVGGRETVAFADGTKIELNTDTVIYARMTTEERMIRLDRGEAYFSVKHDSAHPFVVIAGNRRITDLGTNFVVRHDMGRTEVAVTKGRVRFDAPSDNKPSRMAMLAPGDVATATGSAMSVIHESTDELSSELSWLHGELVFRHTPLGDAVSEFNRYSRIKIVIADPAVAALEIRGTFRTKDAALFARVIRAALNLRVETDGNEIVISR